MKKLLLLTTLAVFWGAQLGSAQTVTYKISAIIPEIIGVNVPDPNLQELTAPSNAQLDRSVERVVRHDRAIILETIVPR